MFAMCEKKHPPAVHEPLVHAIAGGFFVGAAEEKGLFSCFLGFRDFTNGEFLL